MPHEQLAVLCLRLARYKKENKELLAYLLFEAADEHAFAEKVKAEVGFMFSQLPSNNFLAVKSIRKILKLITKYNKFIASKPAEIELLINFCTNYIQYADKRSSYKPLRMILVRQLEKVKGLIKKLHEDLQFDFNKEYDLLLTEASKTYSWFYKNDHLL